jgi:hypothetical protein
MGGETTTIPNITTEAGGNVMYGGTDIGDWLYVCSGGTPFGIVVNVEQGQPGVYGGFNDEGVDALVDTITGYGTSFSPRPSVQHMSGYGWLWSPKQ